MRGVTLLLKEDEFLEAEGRFKDRIKFVFEILDVEDEDDREHVGKEHWVYANMPAGKSGKLSARSTLYELLEGMSGGEFDPDDEIDTEEYVGNKFTGDFKRVQRQKNVGSDEKPKFAPAFDDDGRPIKKTVLQNLQPRRPRNKRATAEVQSEHDWDKLPNAS
jgi:hypothetical protein